MTILDGPDRRETIVAPLPDAYRSIVLLVDDQAMVGEAVRRMIANEPDIDFHYCGDSAEAVGVVERLKPTVILQDLIMPGVDGLTLVRRYRANAATRDIPVIVLSTKEDPVVKKDAFTAGANDYLIKLPDKIELIARIRLHSKAYLNQIQRDEAHRSLSDSQRELLVSHNALAERIQRVTGGARRAFTTGEYRLADRTVFAPPMVRDGHRGIHQESTLPDVRWPS